MSPPSQAQRTIDSIDLATSLRWPAILPHDPTVRLTETRFERATWTPEGPAEIHLTWADGTVHASAWGEGAGWLIDRLDGLVGLDDDVSGFAPDDGRLARLWRRHERTRVVATSTLWHDLASLILQQRVRFVDAADSWRRMVRAWGAPSPGPADLVLPPAADDVARRSYVDFHGFGIERSRAFSWDACARGTLASYRRALEEGGASLS